MGTTAITFDNHRGDRLTASLERPEVGAIRASALFAHCFTCSKDYKAPVFVGRALAERGIVTLRFDFPGLGGSGGSFAETTLSGNVDDVVAAAGYLEREISPPTVLMGHSLGGAAVLRAAVRLPSVRLVATIGAPADPGQLAPPLARAREEALRRGEGQLEVGDRRLPLHRAFFDDLEHDDHERALASLDRALLVFHSPTDIIVPYDNAERIVAAASQPRSLITLPDAGHLLARREDCEYVAAVIDAWTRRYLP